MPQAKKPSIMADSTRSKIPKTLKEKKEFIQARRLTAKQTGRKGLKDQPYGEVVHVYEDEKKAGKVIKDSEIRKTKPSKAVKKYKTDVSMKRK